MISDITCPYCEHEFDIDYADGHVCDEGKTFEEEECPKCEKMFVFTTWISFHHTTSKADCLNDAVHDFKPTHTFPRIFTKMRCSMCDKTRACTEEEKEKLGYWKEHKNNE